MSKVDEIRKEIERLKAETFDNKELSLEEIIAVRNCYNNLLFFIDSLEQPIKRTPADIEAAMQEVEEKSKLFTEAHKDDVVSNDTIDDLEEAARKTGQKYFPNENNIWARPNYEAKKVEYAFKEGAQWQKEQAVKWLKENKDHPFIECEDPCLSGYLTDKFIEGFKKAMEE